MKTAATLPNPAKAHDYFGQKMEFTTGPVELQRAMEEENVVVIDVRAAEDFQRGHIPGAVSIPKDKWGEPAGLQKDKVNILYCYSQVCHLAATAAVDWTARGFPIKELEGGFEGWKAQGFSVETGTRE